MSRVIIFLALLLVAGAIERCTRKPNEIGHNCAWIQTSLGAEYHCAPTSDATQLN